MFHFKGFDKVTGEIDFHNSINFTSESSDLVPATDTNTGPENKYYLCICDYYGPAGQRGAVMVDNQTKNLQWKIFLCSTSRANQIFRGIEEGLGCFLSQDYHAGLMVFCRESFVLKCYGIGSSKASNSFIYKTLSLFLSYLSYLNMGGTQNKHLIEIWGHLIETKIHLTAEHILCLSNQTADWDSRNFQDSTE